MNLFTRETIYGCLILKLFDYLKHVSLRNMQTARYIQSPGKKASVWKQKLNNSFTNSEYLLQEELCSSAQTQTDCIMLAICVYTLESRYFQNFTNLSGSDCSQSKLHRSHQCNYLVSKSGHRGWGCCMLNLWASSWNDWKCCFHSKKQTNKKNRINAGKPLFFSQ